MISEFLRGRVSSGDYSYIDAHFADLMYRMATPDPGVPFLQLCLDLSRALRNQHSCLELAGRDIDRETLRALPVVGPGTGREPLVLEGNRLFLQRYFAAEVRIARRLVGFNRPLAADGALVRQRLATVFPTASIGQQQAVQTALTRGLAIITGGPGTGKTSTVASILSLVAEFTGIAYADIRLAAPTGKAAMRLANALASAGLPEYTEVVTLHRLLGQRDGGRSFRYGPDLPLPVKLLIVDEVSMIDLAMMDRLLAALPDDARLILLGDPDQLPSVDTGSILADICRGTGTTGATTPEHLLTDAICPLGTSFRFSPDRGIGRVSAAVQRGEVPPSTDDDEVSSAPLASMNAATLATFYADYLALVATGADAPTLIAAFEQQRVLTPVRDGDYGVVNLNRILEETVTAQHPRQSPYYHGRPLLVTNNDYRLRLFNGDVGICIRQADGETRVVFADGREFLTSGLPGHETCFVMTVHKSQGSEFDRVALVLPEAASESQRDLQSREMLYTAVTRARHQVQLYFDGDALRRCVQNPVVRHSGLAQRFHV
ncbi:MAG: exodeoxyribonuclease V subunit alpha [Pseudomonadota bacterium]